MDAAKWVEIITGGAVAFALFWSTFRGNLSNDTIKLMKENKTAQNDAIKRLEDTTTVQTAQIAELTGQVKMLKDIPLAQIAKSLEVVSSTHKDMQDFLKDHQNQAENLAVGIANKVIQFLKDNNNGSNSN
jgi:thioesterase domain-containing protein